VFGMNDAEATSFIPNT